MHYPTILFRERPGGRIMNVQLTVDETAVLQELRVAGGYEFSPGWASVVLDDAYTVYLPDTISTRTKFDRILSSLAEKGLYRATDEKDCGEVRPNPF